MTETPFHTLDAGTVGGTKARTELAPAAAAPAVTADISDTSAIATPEAGTATSPAVTSSAPTDSTATAASDTAANQIREQIFTGTIPQGARLREVALSELLGVSRRTVREALLLLAEQRLVVHERHRGAMVRTFQERDIRDLYTVRRTFELEGARNAPFATEEARIRLTNAFEYLREALHSGDARRTVTADLQFHGAVVALAGSDRLSGFYEQMSAEMEMVLVMIRGGEEERGMTAEQLVSEHQVIHDSLLARDVIGAQRAALEHIDTNEQFVLGILAADRAA